MSADGVHDTARVRLAMSAVFLVVIGYVGWLMTRAGVAHAPGVRSTTRSLRSALPWCDNLSKEGLAFPVDACRAPCGTYRGEVDVDCSKYTGMTRAKDDVNRRLRVDACHWNMRTAVCERKSVRRSRDTFSFWANDHQTYKFRLINVSAPYDETYRTYDFPNCPNDPRTNKCFLSDCMGRCGAGCGVDSLPTGCKQYKEKGGFSGNPFHPNDLYCHHGCLNHDLCSYTQHCPTMIEWLGDAKPDIVGCNGGPFRRAALDYLKVGFHQDCKDLAADGM